MKAPLKQALSDTVHEAIESGTQFVPRNLASRIMSDYPKLVKEESGILIESALTKQIKDILKNEEDASQPDLFGFPRVIAIPADVDGGFEWLGCLDSNWVQLLAGRTIRANNVERAQAKLDAYDLAIEHVRPLMEGTKKTVRQIIDDVDEEE